MILPEVNEAYLIVPASVLKEVLQIEGLRFSSPGIYPP